ncbi:hypothetical protein RRF57_008559 [Xylaria bambusicola]|uniref:Uncharacterized protein n=1 Tax=Xylaria bambusicola TaxID=326684 RepID=A0AAN7UI23_9PEZI
MSLHLLRGFIRLSLPLPNGVCVVVERLKCGALLEENPSLEPPRDDFGNLVVNELAGRDSEYIVELLECALLGLRNQEEDHEEGQDVEASVQAEGTNGS